MRNILASAQLKRVPLPASSCLFDAVSFAETTNPYKHFECLIIPFHTFKGELQGKALRVVQVNNHHISPLPHVHSSTLVASSPPNLSFNAPTNASSTSLSSSVHPLTSPLLRSAAANRVITKQRQRS